VYLRQAYLLKVFEEAGENAPRLDEVAIYIPRKSWGLITDDVDPELVYGDYEKWEYEFLDHSRAITCEELRKNQDEYIWRCDFFELKELIDVKPKKNSRYIWGVTEPFDVKMELNEEIIFNWLNHFNIKKVIRKHVSGHANKGDLECTIQKIKPKLLIPIHTLEPRDFKQLHGNVEIPIKNQEIIF